MASNKRKINEWWIEKYVEGSGRGLIWDAILAFAWRDSRKPRKTSVGISCLHSEILTPDLSNTNQECLPLEHDVRLVRKKKKESEGTVKRNCLLIHQISREYIQSFELQVKTKHDQISSFHSIPEAISNVSPDIHNCTVCIVLLTTWVASKMPSYRT
jgi:hypothetical protein